jgi:hypothetical protein
MHQAAHAHWRVSARNGRIDVVPNLIKEGCSAMQVRVSTGSFRGKPDLRFELPTGLGQVYRENQYVSDVSYRFDIREVAGELVKIWGYVEIVDGIQDQFGYGDEYTLRLDNGRPIEIVIKTLNFNNGEYLFADKSAE